MSLTRKALGAFWIFAGVMHFVIPGKYESTVPESVPMSAHDAVAISGVAEIAGGLAVLDDRTRTAARWGLLALLLAVFPANIHMAINQDQIRGLEDVPSWTLWARLPVQALFAYWVWKGTEPDA